MLRSQRSVSIQNISLKALIHLSVLALMTLSSGCGFFQGNLDGGGQTPVISSVSPSALNLSGGQTVTIVGANFSSSTVVSIGTVLCTQVVVIDPSLLTCRSPIQSTPGPLDVRVASLSSINGKSEKLVTVKSGAVTYLSALAMGLPNISLITGEAIALTASGGSPGYIWSDGLGLVNSSTGLLQIPLTHSPTTESVAVTDSSGSIASASLRVRAFELKETFQSTFSTTTGTAVASDAIGNSYAAGYAFDAGGNQHAIVRKSSDVGATWTTVDDFQYPTSANLNTLNGITVDAGNRIFAVILSRDSGFVRHWIVRRSVDQGVTWTTVDDDTTDPQSIPLAIASDPTSSVLYTAGTYHNGGGSTVWRVRKSIDHGASWANCDSFSLSSNASTPVGIAIDSNGYIYVSGTASDSSGFPNLITRKSMNNGSSWTTVDSLFVGAGVYGGNIVAKSTTGELFSAASVSGQYSVRRSADQGATWSTLPISAPGSTSGAPRLTIDQTGIIYATALQGAVPTIYKSANNGLNWVAVDAPSVSANSVYSIGICSGQVLCELSNSPFWNIRLLSP